MRGIFDFSTHTDNWLFMGRFRNWAFVGVIGAVVLLTTNGPALVAPLLRDKAARERPVTSDEARQSLRGLAGRKD